MGLELQGVSSFHLHMKSLFGMSITMIIILLILMMFASQMLNIPIKKRMAR